MNQATRFLQILTFMGAVALVLAPPAVHAQTTAPADAAAIPARPTPPEPAPAAPAAAAPATQVLPAPPFASLDWLEGCWLGSANKREFREVWLPQRGGMMLGVSQTVSADKTLDFEYLRMEPRADGVYYVASPPGKPEEAFKLAAERVDAEGAHTFDFVAPAREFPRRIGYRRASEGWLYTEVEGKVKGVERLVIYPMRRIDCESGELLKK